MGDTATTVDQRGTGSSNGIIDGASALRRAAAQGARPGAARGGAARRATADLVTRDGAVVSKSDARNARAYGELIGGTHLST
jgi:CO/xanthine dehydrogenase Mo-binding subunit